MTHLRLFEGYGIELEYMIVDRDSLAVRPIADELLRKVGGGYEMEVEVGPVAWSNELALHVVEIKTNGPAQDLSKLGATFQEHIEKIEALLEPENARLLPSGMHPLMNPDEELRLWPHEDKRIYNTFDRIFDCRGHGWSNLQSTHINLPFSNDEEFGRLHAAIRMVLPILPALAASSPVEQGRLTGMMDTRLHHYRHNADRVFSVTGHVVPERVFTRDAYEQELLQRIYRDLAPLDPEGVLSHEWVNARGCIARFDRMALEIRVLDIQECPAADLAVVGAVTSVVRALVDERWASVQEQQAWDERDLYKIFEKCVDGGDLTEIDDVNYLSVFGYETSQPVVARELWQKLFEACDAPASQEWEGWFDVYARNGCLARRIERRLANQPTTEEIKTVYTELAQCLREGELFAGEA